MLYKGEEVDEHLLDMVFEYLDKDYPVEKILMLQKRQIELDEFESTGYDKVESGEITIEEYFDKFGEAFTAMLNGMIADIGEDDVTRFFGDNPKIISAQFHEMMEEAKRLNAFSNATFDASCLFSAI